jgi:type II secretory pathway component PulK
MAITRASELFAQVGMTLATYRKLEPYVVALPNDTKLNVCTAPALVLDSLNGTGSQYSNNATTFASNRTSGCFPTLTQIKNDFKGDANFDQMLANHPDYLVDTSSYFRANILVTIGTTELALYSVLNRSGTASNARVRIIQRSFGTT